MNKFMIKNLNIKTCKLAIIGLGYVGLPLAVVFAKNINIIVKNYIRRVGLKNIL